MGLPAIRLAGLFSLVSALVSSPMPVPTRTPVLGRATRTPVLEGATPITQPLPPCGVRTDTDTYRRAIAPFEDGQAILRSPNGKWTAIPKDYGAPATEPVLTFRRVTWQGQPMTVTMTVTDTIEHKYGPALSVVGQYWPARWDSNETDVYVASFPDAADWFSAIVPSNYSQGLVRFDLDDGSKQVILEGVNMEPDGQYHLTGFSFEFSTYERYLAYVEFHGLAPDYPIPLHIRDLNNKRGFSLKLPAEVHRLGQMIWSADDKYILLLAADTHNRMLLVNIDVDARRSKVIRRLEPDDRTVFYDLFPWLDNKHVLVRQLKDTFVRCYQLNTDTGRWQVFSNPIR